MGKTERVSSHWACRAVSKFEEAGKFEVAISLFTGASSIRRGRQENVPPPPCVLRDTAKRLPRPLPDVLLHRVPVEYGRQTPELASTGRWRIPSCRIPPPLLPDLPLGRACAASLAPECGLLEAWGRSVPVAPCIPAHQP